MEERIENALRGGEFKKLLENQFSEIKTKYSLKVVEIRVLYYLSECGEHNTPTDIHHRLKLNRGHVSQAILSLCNKDYITAVPDREDHRRMHYFVSDQVRDIIRDVTAVRQKLDEELFYGVSQEEMEVYNQVVGKIGGNIRRMMKES